MSDPIMKGERWHLRELCKLWYSTPEYERTLRKVVLRLLDEIEQLEAELKAAPKWGRTYNREPFTISDD